MQKDLDFLCFCIIFVLEIRVIVACLVKWWVYSEEVRYIRFHISCIRVEECVVWRIGWYKYRLLVCPVVENCIACVRAVARNKCGVAGRGLIRAI